MFKGKIAALVLALSAVVGATAGAASFSAAQEAPTSVQAGGHCEWNCG
ncbi:hypothetical protein [Nonomuraea sp. MG754425]|nr:hypothetical protein [Nonomuraea sp. MG754425]